MKNFNLLLRNCSRIMWKFKFLILQLCMLLFIAITILSSVFLSNVSLNASYNHLIVDGVSPDLSIQKYSPTSSVAIDISTKDSSNQLIPFDSSDNNPNFKSSKAKQPYQVYTPASVSNLPVSAGSPNIPVYGFNQFYANINAINPKAFPNLIYSPNFEYCIPVNDVRTPIEYKDRLYNLISFYNNGLYPSELVKNPGAANVDISGLYNQSIYSFDPWSIKLNNGVLSTSEFGLANIQGFSGTDEPSFLVYLSTYDNVNKQIVTTSNTFAPDTVTQAQMDTVNNQVVFSNTEFLINNDNMMIPGKPMNTINDLRDFLVSKNSYNVDKYSEQLFGFLKQSVQNFKASSFATVTDEFSFHYKIDAAKSTGLASFISSKGNQAVGEYKKYFEGDLTIPVVPYLTVTPVAGYTPTIDELKQPINLATTSNWTPNNRAIKSYLLSAIEVLKINLLDKYNEFLEKLSTTLDPKYQVIYKEYLDKFDIEQYLKSKNYKYSVSSNFVYSSLGASAIVSEYEQNPEDNKLVLEKGLGIQKSRMIQLDTQMFKIEQVVTPGEPAKVFEQTLPTLCKNKFQLLDGVAFAYYDISKENFLKHKLYNLFAMLSQADFELGATDKDYIWRYTAWLGDPKNTENWNLYFSRVQDFCDHWTVNKLDNIGYGYRIALNQHSAIPSVYLSSAGIYTDTTSSAIVLSQNYNNFKNGSKSVVDSKFISDALQLPTLTYKINQDDINKNPYLFQKHYIYNPYSNKTEFYNDFNDWVARLDDKFKINFNSNEYVIIGSGLSPEFMYPVTSQEQMLVDNNSPVFFVNETGFTKAHDSLTNPISSHYWVNVPTLKNKTHHKSVELATEEINDKFWPVYNNNISYPINDPSQPDQLLYARMNFSKNILQFVIILTSVIGVIIASLAIFFLSILLRSIIKQNLNTFAIGLANGITKRKLALSFFPLALIPSFAAALIGYGISLLTYPLINNAILTYWTLGITPAVFSFLVFGSIFLITAVLMFVTMICVIYWTLRKPTAVLLANGAEYKVNKLMQWTKPALTRMGALASFRGTFIFKNFSRFLVLIGLMTMFMTMSSMFVSLSNSFSSAMSHTLKNKDYNYSVDFYTPTESGGYISPIKPEDLGTSKYSFTQIHALSNDTVYGLKYKDALTYTNPLDPTKQIFYSNLALPSVNYVAELQNNINFFKNKYWIRLVLDIDIQFLNININPWAWAKRAIPPSMLKVADDLYENQMTDVFKYFIYESYNWDTLSSINRNDQLMYTWYIDPVVAKENQFSLYNDLNNSSNPEDWNQSNWCYKYIKDSNGTYYWKPSTADINYGLPTYEFKPSYLKLVSTILALPFNPLYNYYLQQTNQPLVNRNYYLGTNFLPYEQKDSQLYTYIDAKDAKHHETIRIKGIDPTINLDTSGTSTPKFYLYDEYSNINLVNKLKWYEDNMFDVNGLPKDGYYPLIINEVVHKKYGYNINDTFEYRVQNHYERFKFKSLNKPQPTAKFKIIGITTSKSEEQYFTTQKSANKILGFKKPVYKPTKDIIKDETFNCWSDKQAIEDFVPFNGVITSSEIPEFLKLGLMLYTPSGLNPLSNQIPFEFTFGDELEQIKKNWTKINPIVGFDLVDPNISNPLPIDVVNIFAKNYMNIFSEGDHPMTSYYLASLNSIDPTIVSKVLGIAMDKTSNDIMTIIISAFVPTLIIIILLLSFVIVQEARRLIALLKVQGFGDWTNAISLSFIYYIVLGISLLFNIGLNYLLSWGFSKAVFSMFNIIISPVAPWWIYVVTTLILLAMVLSLTLSTFFKLKNANLVEEISVK